LARVTEHLREGNGEEGGGRGVFTFGDISGIAMVSARRSY